VVGFGDTKNHPGALGTVLPGDFVRAWLVETGSGYFSPGGLVPQESSYLISDALALVRKELWAQEPFYGLTADTETVKVPRVFMERLTDALCYAA
jgi:hypothetical protein